MDPATLEFVVPLVAMVLTFGFAAWVIWLINRTRRERMLRTIELQNKLFERFASAQEFVSFLQTPDGQKYLRSFGEEPRRSPADRILKSIRTGVVLVIFGVGLIALSFMIGFHRPVEEPPFVIGFLSLFLGFGFIGSAVVSRVLSKAWGLLPGEQQRATGEPVQP